MCELSRSAISDSFTTPWSVARQAPLSTGFLRQDYWSGLPFPSPGDLPDPGIKPGSPALAGRFFTTSPTWEAWFPQSLQQFMFRPTVIQDSLFSTASPTLAVTCLFDNTHSNRCEVISHCSFYLHSIGD